MVIQHEGFTTEDLYVVGKAGHFHAGEPGRVLNFTWLTPNGGERRLCVHVLFDNGDEDYLVFDLLEIHIYSETDIQEGLHLGK